MGLGKLGKMKIEKKKNIVFVSLLLVIVVIGGIIIYKKSANHKDDNKYFCDSFSVTQSADTRWVVHPFVTDSAFVVIIPAYWNSDSLMVRYEGDGATKPFVLSGHQITSNWEKMPVTIGLSQEIRFTNEQKKYRREKYYSYNPG